MKRLLGLLLVSSLLRATETAPALPEGLYAEIATPRGAITCELFFRQAPLTVANFTGLAEGALGPAPRHPYYEGLKFHRVVPDFVIQGGDPLGTGEGDPGYKFPDEFVPGLRHDRAGILSMANGGPDTNGSQFFLTLRETNRLNYLHSVFGRVVRGLDVLPQVQRGDAMSVRILRVGAAARGWRVDEASFAAQAERAKKYAGPPEPGEAAHFHDPDGLLPADPPRGKYFNYKLANFERTTGFRLYARLRARAPADEDLAALAKRLGAGALVVYVAERDAWRVWPADDALLAAARAAGAGEFAAQEKKAAPDRPLPPAQKLKLQTDAVLDALIFKYEPKAQP